MTNLLAYDMAETFFKVAEERGYDIASIVTLAAEALG